MSPSSTPNIYTIRTYLPSVHVPVVAFNDDRPTNRKNNMPLIAFYRNKDARAVTN